MLITMVYVAWPIKNIAQLQPGGTTCHGPVVHGNTIRAVKKDGPGNNYGFAGDVEEVNAAAIDKLLQAEFVRVLSITHNKKGNC